MLCQSCVTAMGEEHRGNYSGLYSTLPVGCFAKYLGFTFKVLSGFGLEVWDLGEGFASEFGKGSFL